MATILIHIIGSFTYLIGIMLLTNSVTRIYVNEILYQNGITTKGRIIRRNKEVLCAINKFKHHYLTIEFIIYSAQSLICNIKFKVTKKIFDDNLFNDFLYIIYSKQDNKIYHNIKQRMDNELKPISLYSNILLSMFIMSFYPFIYFLSSQYTLFILSIGIILSIISVPHHLRCDYYQNNKYCIKRMANTNDLAAFNIDAIIKTDIDSSSMNENEDIMMNHDENSINSDSQTTSNMTDIDDVSNEQNEIIDQPQETIAILYESYMEAPKQHDDYVMVFN